jgi:tetratricopeptide (TPR) repeat protein
VLAAAVAFAHEHEGHAGDPPAAFLEHAYDLLEGRRAEEALAFLQFGLDHYPLDRDLNLLYLEVLREDALELIAQPLYAEKLEHHYDQPILLYAAGFLSDDDKESYELYKRAIELDEGFAPAYVGTAEIHVRRGDLVAAEAILGRAINAESDYYPAYALRGELYLLMERTEEGVADLKRAVEGSRYAPAARAALAGAYLEAGDAEAARDEYRRAIALSQDRGEYYLGLGRAQEELGEVAAARLSYETAFSRAYGRLSIGVAARKAAGRLAFEEGDYVGAAEHVGWAVAFDEDDAELHAYLGELYLIVDRPAEAAAEFTWAADLEPEEGRYWLKAGRSCARADLLEAAEEALCKAVVALPPEETAEAERELAAVRARRAEEKTLEPE